MKQVQRCPHHHLRYTRQPEQLQRGMAPVSLLGVGKRIREGQSSVWMGLQPTSLQNRASLHRHNLRAAQP